MTSNTQAHGQIYLRDIRAGLEQRVYSALSRSGLRPLENFITRYPHELSGREQQRVVIAGALSLDPSVIIAGEPVSSLDASVRGEILKLILDLRDQLSLSVLIVSNDLGVGWNIADRMAVMYLGWIVEVGTVDDVPLRPQHPYTQALISVLPDGQRTGARSILAGEPPDPMRIPSACWFHPRCPRLAALSPGDPRGELCRGYDVPVLAAGSEGQRLIACRLGDMAQEAEPRRLVTNKEETSEMKSRYRRPGHASASAEASRSGRCAVDQQQPCQLPLYLRIEPWTAPQK